eukprot:Skav232455  [mRNA]  locus=scaffold75:35795:38830:- [translate_table: standard]
MRLSVLLSAVVRLEMWQIFTPDLDITRFSSQNRTVLRYYDHALGFLALAKGALLSVIQAKKRREQLFATPVAPAWTAPTGLYGRAKCFRTGRVLATRNFLHAAFPASAIVAEERMTGESALPFRYLPVGGAIRAAQLELVDHRASARQLLPACRRSWERGSLS